MVRIHAVRGRPGPLGLALVHDLLNTISAYYRAADLLDDLADAQAWVDQALDGWAQEAAQAPAQVRLTEHDLEELRGLRAELRGLLTSLDGEDSRGDVTGAAPAVHVAAAALRMDREGRVVLEPRGQGWRYVAALVLLEVFQAQRADTWRRLQDLPQRPLYDGFLRPLPQQQRCVALHQDLRQPGEPARPSSASARAECRVVEAYQDSAAW